jgi:hypothetical protein
MVRDRVSQPYKATGKILALHILIFTLLGERETKDSQLRDSKFSAVNNRVSKIYFLVIKWQRNFRPLKLGKQ